MSQLAFIVNSYSGDCLALEKSFDERFFLVKEEADDCARKLNEQTKANTWKVIPIVVSKGTEDDH